MSENRGGQIPCVGISVRDGTGVDPLLERIPSWAEMNKVASSRNDTEICIVLKPIVVFLYLFTAFKQFFCSQCPQAVEAVAGFFSIKPVHL